MNDTMSFCRACGRQIHSSAPACPGCGAPQPGASVGAASGLKYVLPVGRSGWAIAAGYLGLISVCLVPGPLALLCGFLALGEIRRHDGLGGRVRAFFGIVMGALGTVGLVFFLIFSWRQ